MNTQPKQGEIKLPVSAVSLTVFDADDMAFASCYQSDFPPEQAKQHAQAIAHALNSREELIKAGETMVDVVQGSPIEPSRGVLLAAETLRAALAKANGEKI